MIDDTIAAISTPIGDAGIGIIRLSGPLAIQVVFEIFKPKRDLNKIKSHKLIYGHIINPLTGDFVDEVLLSIMKGPKSYTREDVVEINSHSGIVVLRKILDIVLIYGVRIAQPGEFTKRAFLNGRIDLAQAEAVMDIIRARTDASLKIACEQMEGKLSKKIKDIYNRLVDLLAYIEADIDYPEDDVSPVNFLFIEEKINEIISEIEGLLANAEYGKIFREGIKVAIVGRTNVGKSSLLNALLKENRAIVTEIPGTTRDSIEEYLNLSGIPVQIIDTAGIRETIDTIEKIGVQKTREIIEKSDLILYVMDVSEDFTSKDMEILNSITSKKFILIMNK
ncbi:MAG TPA: tRNA uridine-5-carboxymethylaminomethyl(34) synthesis GTPase MnmE, partial [Candidatus Eremiobacteraeota bacterium]|nr:tRNA uridine-5-carboxymethylaminomethyl(34) synthesis GTPase MnmE [Candidatus Eremiobacteraeota bacterium]